MTLLALTMSAAPCTAADAKTGTLVAGGVVLPDGQRLVVQGRDRGIEAFALETGAALWTNPDGGTVAGASEKWVVSCFVVKGTIRVVVVDAATGKTIAKEDAVKLPAWWGNELRGGNSFRSVLVSTGDGSVLYWTASTFYAGGAAPSEAKIRAASNRTEGLVEIDPAGGRIKVVDRKLTPEEQRQESQSYPRGGAGGYEIVGRLPAMGRLKITVKKYGKELWARELNEVIFLPPVP